MIKVGASYWTMKRLLNSSLKEAVIQIHHFNDGENDFLEESE